MRIAIACITGRREPRIDWLLEGLSQQARSGDRITIIVADQIKAWETGHQVGMTERLPPFVDQLIHVASKPNPWSGPSRLTDCEWWSKSNNANTAIVMAPEDVDYIVFIDDRCRIGPRWLDVVRQGFAQRSAVLAGSYERLESRNDQQIVVVDHRREREPSGRENCGGGWCYGCCIALPLEWALDVNGFEEGCDSLSGEDYIFGLMLERAGRRVDYSTDLFVTLDRTTGNRGLRNENGRPGPGKGGYAALDKGTSLNNKSRVALARFGRRSRTEFTPNLRALRAMQLAGALVWPLPDAALRDWYDGQLVREMRSP